MAENKTIPTGSSVDTFLDAVPHPTRRADAMTLNTLFQRVTGWQPQMWGSSIIGYGRYDYTYASGRSGSFLATGFAPRSTGLVVYIMPGYDDFTPILDRLGKWKKGKSCLYITKLADIDLNVLEELIRAGLDGLAKHWPIQPT